MKTVDNETYPNRLLEAAMYVMKYEDAFNLYDFITDLNYSEEDARDVLRQLEERDFIRRSGEDWWKSNERADFKQFFQPKATASTQATEPSIVLPAVKSKPATIPLMVLQLDNGNQLEVAEKKLKVGIKLTKGFAKKKLAQYAINTGIKCGVGCSYCSTAAMVRTHSVFQEIGRTSFENGYAVLNSAIVENVKRDAKAIKLGRRGMIEISTIVDAWAPEALDGKLGRECLKAVLDELGWTVRILSKRKEMAECFDLVEKCPERVLVGMSITAMPDKEHLVSVIEPNAASISERMEMMREASRRGFRVYGMICPLLPEIGGKPEQVVGLIKFCEEIGAEEIFAENLNARGRSIVACEEALREAGHIEQADALNAIREGQGFAEYVLQLVQTTQAAMREHSDISKLRFLLYTKGLPEEVVTQIRQDPDGIVFLDDEKVDASDLKRIPETQSVMPWKGQSPTTKLLALREMTVDFDLQCRKEPDENQVREYAAEMKRGVQFPPAVVFDDGSSYWLADGFHRFWAAQLAGLRQLEVQVYGGGPAQAIAYAAGANGQHGMRRTNADKRLAIRKLMVDAGLATRTDSVIADIVGVDHKTVGKVRKELTASGEIPHSDERLGSDGRSVRMDKQKALPESSFKAELPEGFGAQQDTVAVLLKSLDALENVGEDVLGSGFNREQLQALPPKLRAMADRVESALRERIESSVPKVEAP